MFFIDKYFYRSHYDCIRSLRFHATEPLLITASEDETLKLWNLNKPQASKSEFKIFWIKLLVWVRSEKSQ